jgi:hypothetical protein
MHRCSAHAWEGAGAVGISSHSSLVDLWVGLQALQRPKYYSMIHVDSTDEEIPCSKIPSFIAVTVKANLRILHRATSVVSQLQDLSIVILFKLLSSYVLLHF